MLVVISVNWMKRKQQRWWMAFMLSAFCMRSLIPVGFMPMVGPGHGIRLVVCDSYAPVPWRVGTSMDMSGDMPMDAGMDMSRHHHADGATNSGGGPPVHQDHGSCPYGSGPALGTLPTLAVAPVALHRPAELAVASAQVAYFEIPRRAQSPRGPPA